MTAAKVTRIPSNAPKPQDRQPPKKRTSAAARKAAEARRAEAEKDGYVMVEQCGVTLKVPVGGAVPLDAYLVFSGDEETLRELGIKPEHAEIAGTKLLLGPEQWAEFRKAGPTLEDFAEVGNQLEELLGN